jgi:hypothetical protein
MADEIELGDIVRELGERVRRTIETTKATIETAKRLRRQIRESHGYLARCNDGARQPPWCPDAPTRKPMPPVAANSRR